MLCGNDQSSPQAEPIGGRDPGALGHSPIEGVGLASCLPILQVFFLADGDLPFHTNPIKQVRIPVPSQNYRCSLGLEFLCEDLAEVKGDVLLPQIAMGASPVDASVARIDGNHLACQGIGAHDRYEGQGACR